jgi:23S rRNA (adenine2503-C2)-methyltransferase
MRAREKITLEYLLLKGVNDSDVQALALVRLLAGVKCKINLIRFNRCPKIPFFPPEEERVLAFQDILRSKGIITTLRKSKGSDIAAACGQLKAESV